MATTIKGSVRKVGDLTNCSFLNDLSNITFASCKENQSTIRIFCSRSYLKACLTILILLTIQSAGRKINSLLSKNWLDHICQILTCSIKVGDAMRHKRNAVRHEKNASRHKRNAPRHIEWEVTFYLEHSILIEFQPNNEIILCLCWILLELSWNKWLTPTEAIILAISNNPNLLNPQL